MTLIAIDLSPLADRRGLRGNQVQYYPIPVLDAATHKPFFKSNSFAGLHNTPGDQSDRLKKGLSSPPGHKVTSH